MTDVAEKGELLDEQRFAATRETAIAISGLKAHQVDYWARIGLVRPDVDQRLSPGNRVRLYGFRDLLALTVAAELRLVHGLSPQYIRRIVEHLQSRGYDDPLTQVTYAVLGKELYFRHTDGTWEGGKRPDQIVEHRVLDLRSLRRRIRERSRRDPALGGQVERRRGRLGSKPVFAGTRIPIETVREYLQAGRSTDEVLDAFPDLTADDLAAAAEAG